MSGFHTEKRNLRTGQLPSWQSMARQCHLPVRWPRLVLFLSSTWGRADQHTSHDSTRVWGVLFCTPSDTAKADRLGGHKDHATLSVASLPAGRIVLPLRGYLGFHKALDLVQRSFDAYAFGRRSRTGLTPTVPSLPAELSMPHAATSTASRCDTLTSVPELSNRASTPRLPSVFTS
jgi:hypothetical protein